MLQSVDMELSWMWECCNLVPLSGKLYAVGGYDGASRQCLSTVEEYNPISNRWGFVADMGTRRSGAGTEPARREPLFVELYF